MKICTRCYSRDETVIKHADTLAFTKSAQEFELCKQCSDDVIDFISNPKPEKIGTLKKKKKRSK